MVNMKIDFYYWGSQCPYNYINIKQLRKLEGIQGIEINYLDFSDKPLVAKEKSFYSPTFAIINESYRWTGPLWDKDIEQLKKGILPRREVVDAVDGKKIIEEKLVRLDRSTAHYAKNKCTSNNCIEECQNKIDWIGKTQAKYSLDCLGILHIKGEECLGGAEYMPSREVPYDIEKSEDIAFLTCIYSSDSQYDYKDYPLRELEKVLSAAGYKELHAVASPKRTFPNGTLEWFLKRGYEKERFLYYEEVDEAEQYLVKKRLVNIE